MIENTEELLGQIVPSGSVVGAMLTEKGEKGDKGDTGNPGNPGADGISPIITTEKQGKVTTITIVDAEGTKTATINDGADGSGGGDMYKSTYDTNENGVVDNAEKVNNHTVLSDVPANAVFTDTTYTAGTGIDITNGVITNTQTSAEWGKISGSITNQTDLSNALNNKADTNDIPTSTSDLTNDSGFITAETDPVFSASAAAGITSTDISNWDDKQDGLVSGTNIKTINNTSILGSGDISIEDSYSTTEKRVGTWIDDKPIYRKTIVCNPLPDTAGQNYSININDLNEIINWSAIAINKSSGQYFPLPFYRSNDMVGIELYFTDSNGITIVTGNDRTGFKAYVTLDYTKTTD